MSKAFVKDDADDGKTLDTALEEMNPLPKGVTNYITARGLAKFKAEAESKRAQMALQGAVVAGPAEDAPPRVVFGARVRTRDEDDEEKIFEIVGVFESEPKLGRISWLSPLAKAFLGHKKGDVVLARLPSGETEYEILAIEKIGAEP